MERKKKMCVCMCLQTWQVNWQILPNQVIKVHIPSDKPYLYHVLCYDVIRVLHLCGLLPQIH